MSYECKIEDRDTQSVVFVRLVTPASELPEVMGSAFGEIMAHLGQMGVDPTGPPYSAYYNMDMENLDVEMGVPVSETLPGEGDVQARVLPATRVASTVHTGPYQEFEKAYNALQAYMDEQGVESYFKQQAGKGNVIAYEFYLNAPGEVEPEDLQTLILLPIK